MKVGEDGGWGASAKSKGQWGMKMVIGNLMVSLLEDVTDTAACCTQNMRS